eukprot:gene10655-biopygen13863
MVPWWHPQEVGVPGFWRVLSPAGLCICLEGMHGILIPKVTSPRLERPPQCRGQPPRRGPEPLGPGRRRLALVIAGQVLQARKNCGGTGAGKLTARNCGNCQNHERWAGSSGGSTSGRNKSNQRAEWSSNRGGRLKIGSVASLALASHRSRRPDRACSGTSQAQPRRAAGQRR